MTTAFRIGVVGAVAALALALVPGFASSSKADDSKGRRVFDDKECSRCHVPGGRSSGPPLEELRRPQGEWELTGRLWNHVPGMFTALSASSVPWPRFTPDEVADLMTYLTASPDADAKPNPARGRTLLVQKSCLKCHALHGEGGRIAPDFAGLTAAFASPTVWAARVWAHTPTMALEATKRGIPYPRFGDREMVHLIAYLKSVGAKPGAR
jgi:cytochrome c2